MPKNAVELGSYSLLGKQRGMQASWQRSLGRGRRLASSLAQPDVAGRLLDSIPDDKNTPAGVCVYVRNGGHSKKAQGEIS